MKRHPDGRAAGDGVGVGAEDLGERGAVRARRLRVNDVLRVLEADAEEDLAVPGLVATDAAVAGERVDLQLEDPGGACLKGGVGVGGRWERVTVLRVKLVQKQYQLIEKDIVLMLKKMFWNKTHSE